MIYSTSTEYAIRGLCELAGRSIESSSATVMLEQVVVGTTLPREFLSKLFQQLVKGGILTSAKGRHGGFALARPTHQITLFHIVAAIDGNDACDRCVVGLDACTDAMHCPQHDLFKPIRHRIRDYLQTTTLADMIACLRSKPGWPNLPHLASDPTDTPAPGS